MCRLAAAHETLRLMLLGLPPDMVHGVLLHRARTSIFRNNFITVLLYHTKIILSSTIFVLRETFSDKCVYKTENCVKFIAICV